MANERRKRHQDRLRPAAGSQPEDGAAIVEEIELHIPAATPELMDALVVPERLVAPAFDDRLVRLEKAIGCILPERDSAVIGLELVEEDAPDAARLPAVTEPEVFIASALEARIPARVVIVAHALEDAVKMNRVLLEKIIRREVGAAAEPGAIALLDVAEVGVRRWHHRAARMEDERDARREELAAFAGKVRRELLRQLPEDHRGVDARLLENVSVLEDSGDAAAAARSLPAILSERLPVEGGERRRDRVLHLANVFAQLASKLFRHGYPRETVRARELYQ